MKLYLSHQAQEAVKIFSKRGAIFSTDGGVFGPNVVVDGNLVTGQNPASAGPLADAIMKLLKLGSHAENLKGAIALPT